LSFVLPANFRQIPTVWETAQPFHIDATGAVAFDIDPVAWARNHILALLLTNPGERVMRPSYGVGIGRILFENDTPLLEQQLITTINTSLAIFEPNITVTECRFMATAMYSGTLDLQIAFTVGASPSVHGIQVTLDGTGVEVITP